MSSFARLPHSDIGNTKKNLGKNTIHALKLCDNEKADAYLAKDKLDKPEYVLKSTLNQKDELLFEKISSCSTVSKITTAMS